MDSTEWITRCAARLQQQWPHTSREELIDKVRSLLAQDRWRRFAPEVAAVAWLRLGG